MRQTSSLIGFVGKPVWIWREWLDIGPGEEAVDLWELTPEVEKFGLVQDKGPPMCEGIEIG